MEDDNSRKEIEEHLHNTEEVKRTSHAVKVLSVPLNAKSNSLLTAIYESAWTGCGSCFSTVPVPFIELPESRHKEKGDNNGLQDLSARDSGLTLCKNPTPVHQLLKLDGKGSFVGSFSIGPVFGLIKFNQLVINLYALVNLKPISIVQMCQFLFIISLLGVLNRQNLHEEVSGVGATGYVELESAEVLH